MDREHCLYLGDNGVQDLALEGAEDDGLVLDGVDDEPLARLDQARPHAVNCRHCNHEPVFACKKHIFYGFTASVADPGCLSRILIFPPSRIPDPKTSTKERGEKNLLSYLFL
jgi:hypothetical protein